MSDIRYWLGFNLVPRIGPVRLNALLSYFGDLEHAWGADPSSLRAAGLPQDALERLLYVRARIDLAAELEKVSTQGIQLLSWESEGYPRLLKSIAQPPPLLYVRGEITPTDEWAVAVVGTRHASVYGKEVAHRLARGLAENRVTVVSGLALGIDGIVGGGRAHPGRPRLRVGYHLPRNAPRAGRANRPGRRADLGLPPGHQARAE